MPTTAAFLRTLACALGVLGTGVAQARADDVARGGELAHALCANCHLNPGQGEKQGAMGVPGFVAVANRPLQSEESIVEWLKSAPPMMPNHRLTQDEIYALSAFIMSLRNPP